MQAEPDNSSIIRRRPWLVALIAAVALSAQACSGASTPVEEGGDDAPGQEDGQAGAAEPSDVKNPGVFVHALGGEPETLDPAAATDGGYGNRAIIQVYEFLVDLPPDSPEPVPML